MSCRPAANMLLVWCSPWALRSGFAGCMGSLTRLVCERGEAELSGWAGVLTCRCGPLSGHLPF